MAGNFIIMDQSGFRHQIRTTLLLLFVLAFSISPGVVAEVVKRPNIIIFLVDDMGWQDTSVPFWIHKTPFNERYHTPSMERLASEGMIFTQAYASSVCSPARVSLMSGMNAARRRVTNWTLERNRSVDGKSDILSYPDWNVNGVQPSDTIPHSAYATMLPRLLKENGYFTIHSYPSRDQYTYSNQDDIDAAVESHQTVGLNKTHKPCCRESSDPESN
jgi:hypothetical protein